MTSVWSKAQTQTGIPFLQLHVPLQLSIFSAFSLLPSAATFKLKHVHLILFFVQEITLSFLTKTIMELIQMLVRKHLFMNEKVITLIVERNYVLYIKADGREPVNVFGARKCSILPEYCKVYKQVNNKVTAKQQIDRLIH
jgi:hypothetical protein